jgi:hypothetical protein
MRASRDKYTTRTAAAPGLVFTVLKYGTSPPSVRNLSYSSQQTSRSRRTSGYARILSEVR